MIMKNPSHPGEIIRELYLEPLGLTVTRRAQGLGVTRTPDTTKTPASLP